MAEISPLRRPHDRGHDDPQFVAVDATIVPLRGIEVQPAFWPLPGSARPGGCPCLPASSGCDGDLMASHEPDRLRAAVLLWHDAGPGCGARADCLCTGTARSFRPC